MKVSNMPNLQRESLRKIVHDLQYDEKVRELAQLRIQYSEATKLLTGYVKQMIGVQRMYPTHLPTQASGRWSTLKPPITNWPRHCINPDCPTTQHSWSDICWSVRDILLPDSDEILVSFDMDNVEGRIHDLIVNDTKALQAHKESLDLHTLTCCDIFGYDYPSNKKDPHNAKEDGEWRNKYKWQGKDTKQRVLAKNFNHGSKYTKNYKFVHRIIGIEQYGITYKELELLAKRYIKSKGEAWKRKLEMMERIQKERVSRTLYGFRRVFFDNSEETAREGFSHMISGTVSDYMNETAQLFEQQFGDSVRLAHNAHDSLKLMIKKDCIPTYNELQSLIEREVEYQNRSILLTASIKIRN